jgi:3-hydroxyacyl-CoA dehydrogenase
MAFGRFERAAVIGSGMMGPGIALTIAVGGVWSRIISRPKKGARRLRKAHEHWPRWNLTDSLRPSRPPSPARR